VGSSKIDYEKVLNPAQLEAVTTLEGPLLVIAGAGSGKTRTLVYRVARLVETAVAPESILLLTFTRKAAQEMLDRAVSLSDPRCRFVSGGTFHSLANRALRSYAETVGYSRSFAIVDRSDMEEIVRSLIPELRVPKGTPRFPKRGTLADILSKAANLQQPLEKVMLEEYGHFLEFLREIDTLSRLYEQYKKTHQLMDYDDLILNLRRILEHDEEARKNLSQQYRYIMVDEYQDTNVIQADIVKWLAHEHRNIMVVGDDAQSIYSFRGANYRNMFDFSIHFPEAKKVKLEENFRSTQPILTFTNALMSQAHEKFTKCLVTKRTGGERPRLFDTRTAPEQALFVGRAILERIQQGRSLRDCAVLFRAAYHSFELEAELTRQSIPYVKYGGFKFLESAHIKDFLAHLRVVVNRDDAVSWIRILRLVKNVGEGKSQSIMEWMRAGGISPGQLEQWPGIGKRDTGLGQLSRFLGRLSEQDMSPAQAVEKVMEYYLPILKERFDDYPRRQRELDQVISMAGRYKKLRSFLDDLILDPPTSPADLRSQKEHEALTLSTVHSAKGLEWPVVFIIWVTEGRFPPARAYHHPSVLEEERRLMYVASTRAKDELILCYPGQEGAPSWSGHAIPWGGHATSLSTFIRDLPEEVVSHESGSLSSRSERRDWQWRSGNIESKSPDRPSEFSPGERVRHPAFGPGVISKLIGHDKVEVFFRDVGRKLLLLEYTTLEKI